MSDDAQLRNFRRQNWGAGILSLLGLTLAFHFASVTLSYLAGVIGGMALGVGLVVKATKQRTPTTSGREGRDA